MQPDTQPATAPTSYTVTLKPDACDTGEEFWFVWTWGTGADRWVKGEQSDAGYVFDNVDDNMIFVRMNSDEADWNNAWNQTEGLTAKKDGTYTLSGWGKGIRINGSW